MGQAVVKKLLSYMLTSFPVPAFLIGPDKPGNPFQAPDHLTGSGKIGLELGDPALLGGQKSLAAAQGGDRRAWFGCG